MATTKIVLLSDSTNGWFVDTAAPHLFLPSDLYDRYGRTVETAENGTFGGSYSSLVTRWYGGAGADEIHLYDGSVGGSNWDDVNDLAVRVTAVAPELVLIAYGINGGADGLEALVDDVQAAVPSATVVMLSQNPVSSDSGASTRRDYIQDLASTYGLTFIDCYQAFVDYGDWENDLLSDGTHPNADGKTLYAETVDAGLLSAGLLGSEQEASTVAVIDSADVVLRANRYSGSGDWLDESGNGHDAVPSGSPTWDGEKFTLNGTSQYFTVADADVLDPGAGDITVVIVAATHATPADGRLLNKRANAVNGWWGMLYESGNARLIVPINDGSDTAQNSTAIGSITPAVRFVASWRLVRATDDLLMTLDGTNSAPVDSSAIGTFNSTSPLVIGASNIGGGIGNWFKGDIYGMAIFTTSLSDADVASVGAELLENDPVGALNVPDGVGLLFPGTDGSYASTPDTAALDIIGDLKIRFRGAFHQLSGYQVVLAKWAAGQKSYKLSWLGAGFQLAWSTDGSAEKTATLTPTGAAAGTSRWYQIALDVDDGAGNWDAALYEQADSATVPSAWGTATATDTGVGATSIFAGTSALHVGGDENGSYCMAGKLFRLQLEGASEVFDADPSDITTWTFA